MKPIRLLGLSASILLLAGSAGAQTVFYPGVLRYQMWPSDNPNGAQNPGRATVEAGQAGLPATDDGPDLPNSPTYTQFDTKEGSGDNYTDRLMGLFVAPATTNYVFFLASDDDSDLFISTDSSSSNKRLIAQEASWSNLDQWTAAGGGSSTPSQKRSDQWSPDGGTTVPYKNGIWLTNGQKYWIEAVHHDGTGGDNVGATYKYVGEPDPTNGAPSRLTASVLGYGYTIPATLSIKAQVTNSTAADGCEATFTFDVANPLPEDNLVIQWYKNNTAISNATYKQYTFLASTADNNAQFKCVVSIPPAYNSTASTTSAVGVLTVTTDSIAYTNGLKVERFDGALRTDVEHGNTGPANRIDVSSRDLSATLNRTGAETQVDDGLSNYGRRMSGLYIPPANGQYVFFISADDDADLFLSTDATQANKALIAQENVWSGSRNWTNAGGSILSQKRSDQWTNDTGTAPFALGINLKGGTPYYIEADSHQGGGGVNLAILAKLVGDPDPTNGAPPIPASQLVLKSTASTTLTWVTQPKAFKVFDPGQALFSGSAKADSEFAVLYQWQRNGTNVAGATRTSYSFTATSADNGSIWTLLAATQEGGLSITSAPVTLTVQQAVFEPGLALMNLWVNQTDQAQGEQGLYGAPDFVMAVPRFEAGVNNENGVSYVNQLSGFFVPAASGSYDFIVSGDDVVDLFLSTDANPLNKKLIAQQPNWANPFIWSGEDGSNNGAGGADNNQKNSGTYTNAAGVAQNPNGISLTQGTKYYIEMWHHEGTGGDSMMAYMKLHSDPMPANGTDGNITGNLVGFNAPNTSTFIAFTNQPIDKTVLSGETATFTAGGESDGNIVIGTTGQFQTGLNPGDKKFLTFPNVLYQWYKNGAIIPGATTSSYKTPALKPGDSAQYYAAIRALGLPNWSNSTIAQLTVMTDTNRPTAFAAVFDNNQIPILSISFSKTMDLASISDVSHYNVTGATIFSILVNSNDARHVTLELQNAPASLPITVTLTGITDFSGNTPVSTTLTAKAAGLTSLDIGDPQAATPDPAFPGHMWADGTNSYTIKCEGSDIWANQDGFNFSYEMKTNDFDVAVRQASFTKVSNWSKGGLMVREDLTAGSRNWNIVNDPASADGVVSIDGSGNGANTVECNARTAPITASGGWATAPGTVPNYPNAWLRLKRTGQLLSAYWSSNGVNWVQEGLTDWSTNAIGPMPSAVYLGICCTAHNNDSVTADPPRYYYTASFADYNSSYVAPTNTQPAHLTASISGGNIVISWTPSGGTLQSSPAVGTGGTWTTVGTANPATVPLSGAANKFFRVGP